MMREKFKLDVPVLFLIFNRLDTTKKVFAEIRRAKPRQLFIAADGPRNTLEKKKTDAVRGWVLENIDWKCNVKTLFRNKNLGCRYASNSALDWFFERVEMGLVLEDDTVPSKSYFQFIQEVLKKYSDDSRIMSVCGHNPFGSLDLKESYFFFREFGSGGCAMWKRSWKKQDLEAKKFIKLKKAGRLNEFFPNFFERMVWKKRAKDMLEGKVSSWSYAFNLAHILNHGLCIVPKTCLINNVGFDERSTHTKGNFIDKRLIAVKAGDISFPLVHPEKVELDKKIAIKWFCTDMKRVILKKIFFRLR